MAEVVIVEGIRRRSLQVRRIVAGAAILDGPAIGATGPARPIERRLQGGVIGIVLGHAPEFHRRPCAALGRRRHGADERECDEKEINGEGPRIHSRERGMKWR